MATSSITKQWTINDPEAAERLLQVIEEGEKRYEQHYVKKLVNPLRIMKAIIRKSVMQRMIFSSLQLFRMKSLKTSIM